MKRLIAIGMIFCLMIGFAYADEGMTVTITTSYETEGIFTLETNMYTIHWYALDITLHAVTSNVLIDTGGLNYSHIKAMITKDSTYVYDLVDEQTFLPLQMGSGKYRLQVLGSSDGRRYKKLQSKNLTLSTEENAVYLSQSQVVNWTEDSQCAQIAQELTEGLITDEEKMKALHTYVIENISYDYNKASQLPKGYIPNPDATLEDGGGICYDFAAVYASMLRSVQIPSKLVKGYCTYTPVYHAWNEVMLNEQWWTVDTSTDSIYFHYNAAFEIKKPEESYEGSKFY